MSDTKKEISQGDPKGEEFVEEIRLLWCEECSEGPGRYGYQASLDDPICAVGAEKECGERARKVITRIAQAIIETGELDEMLGVVGQDKVRCIVDNGMDEGLGLEDVLMYDIRVGDLIIALRKQGQEEEG